MPGFTPDLVKNENRMTGDAGEVLTAGVEVNVMQDVFVRRNHGCLLRAVAGLRSLLRPRLSKGERMHTRIDHHAGRLRADDDLSVLRAAASGEILT